MEKSFIEAEQFITNRLQALSSHNAITGQELGHERVLLAAARAKLDTTRTKLAQCHQDAVRLQANTDARFRLMSSTAKGRLEQVERLSLKMMQYEASLEIVSPTANDTDAILSKSDTTTTRKFQVIHSEKIIESILYLSLFSGRITSCNRTVKNLDRFGKRGTQRNASFARAIRYRYASSYSWSHAS